MSLTSTLSNAVTGLAANSRMAETVSTNLANALNEQFARREVDLSSLTLNGLGGGVAVEGIQRAENLLATRLRRASDAELSRHHALADAQQALVSAFGLPDDPQSLASQVRIFETALINASNNSHSSTSLADAVTQGQRLASTVNQIASDIQTTRASADAEIARQVETLNISLGEIAKINRDIAILSLSGRDASALMDRRAALVDEVARIVPVQAIKRENNTVALFTVNGGTLLNGQASLFSFTPSPVITESMTVANTALGLVSIDGQAVDSTQNGHFLDGGSLGALFDIRDDIAPQATTLIDGFARDLIARFETPGLDPTLVPGAPALFTDAGAALNPAQELGLASRLSVNSLVDAQAGGASWRLRDGLGAAGPGPVGDNSLLLALSDVVSGTQIPASGLNSSAAVSVFGFVAEAVSTLATAAHRSETDMVSQAAESAMLRESELASVGVDSDAQLQMLIAIEQNYAANARVISAVDQMMQILLEM